MVKGGCAEKQRFREKFLSSEHVNINFNMVGIPLPNKLGLEYYIPIKGLRGHHPAFRGIRNLLRIFVPIFLKKAKYCYIIR